MHRRQYLGGAIGGVVLLAGCLGGDDEGANDGETTNDDGETDNQPADALELGEHGRVTEQTTTRPDELWFTEEIVFETINDELVWTTDDDTQYLLVAIELRVTDAPEGELVDRPNPFQYAVHVGEQRFEPRSPPEETNAIVEPARGGYQTPGGRGTENSASWGAIAFELPANVTKADLYFSYENGIDGEPLHWVPDPADD